MNRDEFLAREVMLWHWEVHEAVPGWVERWEGWVAEDGKWRATKWNPGKSWTQTGMILKQMEKDFFVTIRQYDDQINQGYDVTFRKWESDDYGNAREKDFREAIATAVARARGWNDGNES